MARMFEDKPKLVDKVVDGAKDLGGTVKNQYEKLPENTQKHIKWGTFWFATGLVLTWGTGGIPAIVGGALGVAGYEGYRYWKKKREEKKGGYNSLDDYMK